MEDDWGCDVSIGDLMILDDGAERLEVEGGHHDCGEACISGEMNEALKSWEA